MSIYYCYGCESWIDSDGEEGLDPDGIICDECWDERKEPLEDEDYLYRVHKEKMQDEQDKG